MDVLTEFMKAKRDLSSKSPEGYEYEVEIRLKHVTEREFMMFPRINNIIVTEEVLYSVKGSSTITIREIGSEFFIKERILSKPIPEFDAEIVLSLERKYFKEKGMALKIKRSKERHTVHRNGFSVDLTKVTSGTDTHYEIELEVTDINCELRFMNLTMQSIRSSTASYVSRLINKLVPGLDLHNYRFPKPVDITVRELARNYSLGGSVSLKLDGTRTFLAYYEANVYTISTKGEETIIESDNKVRYSLTLFDTEAVDGLYYAFDIVILNGIVVANQPLKERTRLIPQVCLNINKAVKKRLVIAKRHFMFETFSAFSKHHCTLEKQIQSSRYDGLIYTHPGSYFDPVMRWKPQKTVDLLYHRGVLSVRSKEGNTTSELKLSEDSKEPKEDSIGEFIINSDGSVTLLRTREDKTHPNPAAVVNKIITMAKEEENMFDVFKGLTLSMMRSYHNDVKRTLLRKGAGHLLDVGSGRGGDVTKWDHYRTVTCIEPSHTNTTELKRRLGSNKKVRTIQTKIEHLRGFEKSVTTLSCFFCIALVDVDRLIKIAQRVFSDKAKCTFLCTIMSKEYVIRMFKEKGVGEYVCEAYSIKLESNNKVFIHIPGTIVLNQVENLVNVDELIALFDSIGFKLESRGRLNGNRFMSSNEYMLSCMYEYLVMTRPK